MEEMETMMYKSCIFDLDGTLTDTLDSLTFSCESDHERDGTARDYKRAVPDVCGKRKQSSFWKKHCVPRQKKLLRGWRKRWKYMGDLQ
mgnify:CR=1 FL=1